MFTPPREIHDSDSAAYFTGACPIYPVGPVDRTGVESVTIPLGICNSNIRFFKKFHQLSVSGAFLRLFNVP
jgi:hypothetical protein